MCLAVLLALFNLTMSSVYHKTEIKASHANGNCTILNTELRVVTNSESREVGNKKSYASIKLKFIGPSIYNTCYLFYKSSFSPSYLSSELCCCGNILHLHPLLTTLVMATTKFGPKKLPCEVGRGMEREGSPDRASGCVSIL